MDRSQDIRILSSRENGTHTIIKFTRDMDTGDKEDYKIKVGKTKWAILYFKVVLLRIYLIRINNYFSVLCL